MCFVSNYLFFLKSVKFMKKREKELFSNIGGDNLNLKFIYFLYTQRDKPRNLKVMIFCLKY